MTDSWRNVRLPRDLCEAAEKQYADQYGSLEELLTFMLGQISGEEADRLDRSELEIVQQRLKELGYM
jgi:hypothetical protein